MAGEPNSQEAIHRLIRKAQSGGRGDAIQHFYIEFQKDLAASVENGDEEKIEFCKLAISRFEQLADIIRGGDALHAAFMGIVIGEMIGIHRPGWEILDYVEAGKKSRKGLKKATTDAATKKKARTAAQRAKVIKEYEQQKIDNPKWTPRKHAITIANRKGFPKFDVIYRWLREEKK
jgi:hypothetical protein